MPDFDYFVLFAEMRTGSNFLEANINMYDGLSCLGEAFNPHFIGYPDKPDLLGITQAQRDRDPDLLLAAIKSADGLCGFRFFNDHDPRVLDTCLDDPRCAKIILTRNPLDSFISWKIAAATGQWKLTNVTHAKTGQVVFDPVEFETHVAALQAFQVTVLNRLQRSGQTAFYVAYEDLQDVAVMNGLARFLGVPGQLGSLSKKLKKQNPEPMADKVVNFAQMESALARMDQFDLSRTPNFEPRRGPMIPRFFAAPESGLLFMPLGSGPNTFVRQWLAGLDGRAPSDLLTDFTQKTLRDWQQSHAGFRSFTVLRHPVARAHTAFCRHILSTGESGYPEIRATLRKVHGLPIPEYEPEPQSDATYDMAAHKEAFLAFLAFLKGNLSGQTAMRVDVAWASQLTTLQGMAAFGIPDMILREESLKRDLAMLAGQIGKATMPAVPAILDPLHDRLSAIYGHDIEVAAQQAYARDYLSFGFGDWVA